MALDLGGNGDARPIQRVVLVDSNGNAVASTANALGQGKDATVTTAAKQLAALVCQGVVVQNDPDNTGDMLVGNVTAQVFQLTPGQWIYLPVNDVSRVYVKMTSGSNQTVNWLAV